MSVVAMPYLGTALRKLLFDASNLRFNLLIDDAELGDHSTTTRGDCFARGDADVSQRGEDARDLLHLLLERRLIGWRKLDRHVAAACGELQRLADPFERDLGPPCEFSTDE